MTESPKSFGKLRIAVKTANYTLPVASALVYVYSSDDEERVLLYSLITDEDGLTETVSLETPPLADSFSPLGPVPYTNYSILVKRNGYISVNNNSIPIFPGITSLQDVNLISLPEKPLNPLVDSEII